MTMEQAADALEDAAAAVDDAAASTEHESGEAVEAIGTVVAGEAIADAVSDAQQADTALDHESRIAVLEAALATKAAVDHAHYEYATHEEVTATPPVEAVDEIPAAPTPPELSDGGSDESNESEDEAPRRSHPLFTRVFGKGR